MRGRYKQLSKMSEARPSLPSLAGPGRLTERSDSGALPTGTLREFLFFVITPIIPSYVGPGD